MVSYIFIDESGDLGSQSKYLILSALVVQSPDKLDRIIKNMRRYKFKKHLRKFNEIKANRSNPKLVKYMLTKLNVLDDAKVFFIILEKEKCHSNYLNSNVTIQPYINVIVRLNSPQIDNCIQLSNTFEIDGRELSIKN